MAYDVLVEASDPGARIEANHQFVGNAPLHLKIYGDPDGTFHDFGSFEYVVEALPLVTNQYPQMLSFRTGHMFTPEDQIPRRIFFDMTKPNAVYPPTYGVPGPGYPPPAYYGPPAYYYGPPYYGPSFRFFFGPRYHRHY